MHEASMNEFIKLIKSPFNNWILIIFIIITTVHFFHNSISNANQCSSVFKMQNSTNTLKNIDTITDDLVKFYFQSVINDSAQIVSNDGKENTNKPISHRITIGQKISAQNKLMTDLNDLKYLYGESAVNLYYQKIKQRLSQFKQSQKGFEKKKKQKEDEYEKQKIIFDNEYKKTQPQYFRENLVFYRIEPDTFMMGEIGKQIETQIHKPFEMAATLTTQLVWRKIAELANQSFPDKYQIETSPSFYQGDYLPVEYVSIKDIQIWLNALNDLSTKGNQSIVDLIPGHQNGDTYRLPTEAEWEFVVRGRGQFNQVYYFGDKVNQLERYAWFVDISNSMTHPVAEKLPLIIKGNKMFFDMHGNVSEWVSDYYQENLIDGSNPQVTTIGPFSTIRGGSFVDSACYNQSDYRHKLNSDIRINYIGFRLVKEVN